MYSLEDLIARMNSGELDPVGAVPLGGFDAEQRRRKRSIAQPLPAPRPMMQQPTNDILASAVGQPQAPLPPANTTLTERYAPPTLETPQQPGPVHVGQQSGVGRSPLGRKLDEYRALSDADVGNKVKRTDWGYEEQPPGERTPSRTKQALMGALQGFILAGQQSKGDPWATLGGLGTGAAAGAVSPKLMQAYTRDQELDRLRGDITGDQKMELGNAQISETMAQADARRAEPYLRAAQLERQEANDQAAREERVLTRQQRDEDTRIRRERADEAIRHNKAMETRPTGADEREVNGAIYRKDANNVWRLAPGSPPPRDMAREKRTEKDEENAAAEIEAGNLFAKGAEYWDQAQKKREQADKLPRTTPGYDQKVSQLLREAAGLESKTHEVQLKGDGLAAKAKAGATAAANTPTKGGAFNLRQWKDDHPGADPSSVIQRAKDKKLRIIE